MHCTVCNHPQRHAIDHALLAGNGTLAALSQNYGPSLSALWRHKKHLQEKMRQAEKRLEHHRRQDYLFKFNNFLEVATDTVKTAGADGNSRLVLQAVREGTRILNFMAKLDVKLDQDTAYRLLASPQWTTQSSLLPTDPQFIADTHQALADCLFFPCPEPPPIPADEAEDDDDDWDEASVGDEDDEEEEEEEATATADRAHLDDQSLNLLQKLFPDLTEAQPKSDHRKLATENQPRKQREISAKLPRKTARLNHNNIKYQQDKVSKKNTRKNSLGGRESDAPAANQPLETQNSELETPHHESLFDRLRRKWANTPNASKYSCDSEKLYEEYLKKKSPPASRTPCPRSPARTRPRQLANQPPETENPQLKTQNSRTLHETPQPETPKDWEPLNPLTHPKEYYFALEHGYRIENTPKHIPDRRWEEDFGNPRKFKGTY